jgi:hypothetical protein
LENFTKGGNGSLCSPEQRGRKTEGKEGLLTERDEEKHKVEDAGARPETVDGGGGEDRRREGALAESPEGKEPLARSRAGGCFLKHDMGAPDSAQ